MTKQWQINSTDLTSDFFLTKQLVLLWIVSLNDVWNLTNKKIFKFLTKECAAEIKGQIDNRQSFICDINMSQGWNVQCGEYSL